MKEQIQFKGYWFRPLDPANKIAGILHFIPYEKINLELLGGFDTPRDFLKSFVKNEDKHEDIIWGVDENAKMITLINCHRYGRLNFSSEFPMTNYNIAFALVGIHLEKWDEKVFFKLNAELPLLTSWINFSRLHFSMPYCNTESNWQGFDIRFRINEFKDTTVKIDKNLSLTFRHGCNIPDFQSNKPVLDESYSLELEMGEDVDFWEFISNGKKFSKFLTLACGTEVDFINLSLRSKNRYQDFSNENRIFHPVAIYYKQLKPTILPESRKFTDFLFDYAIIKEDLPSIIVKWYQFNETMSPIIQHLIDSINNHTEFRSIDFLIVCQALEGFHRRFINGKNLILKTRLNQLIETFDIIIEIKNIPVQIVVNSRNYYSHLYIEDSREVYKEQALYNLTKSLRTLLTCHLLNKIGLSTDKIKEIICK